MAHCWTRFPKIHQPPRTRSQMTRTFDNNDGVDISFNRDTLDQMRAADHEGWGTVQYRLADRYRELRQ